MWQVLVFGLVGLLTTVFVNFIPLNVSASESTWLTSPTLRLAEAQLKTIDEASESCGSRFSIIAFATPITYKDACIYGLSDGTRLARYETNSGVYGYAIAFPTDGKFTPVNNLCVNLARCGYAHASDTLLIQNPDSNGGYTVSLVKNFSSRIKRQGSHFIYTNTEPSAFLRFDQKVASIQSIGVSANGEWGIASSLQYGLLRIHFSSQTVKLVANPSALSLTQTHRPELTISDDGVWVALTGSNVSTRVWEVKDRCEVAGCEYIEINMSAISHGFTSAHVPRFSSDGQRLVLSVKARSKFFTITLANKPHGTGNPYYLAFGDSFTSGEGETSDVFYINSTNSLTNRCHVSSRSYPYILGSYWDVFTNSVACSGSRIPDVRAASKRYINNTGASWPSLVSVGVGGNDIDLIGKLKNCIGLDTCEWAQGNRLAAKNEIQELFPKMVSILQELQINLSPALFFLVGYPSVINDTDDASCPIPIHSMLDRQERVYMNETIQYLNKILGAAASYVRIPFADIEGAYNGERLCDKEATAMNGIRFGDDIAPIAAIGKVKIIGAESFHPTPRGHTLAANEMYMQLQTSQHWTQWGCASCVFSAASLEPSAYWPKEPNSGPSIIRQLASRFLESDIIKNISSVVFNFPANTFRPYSSVRLELHSDVQNLGLYTAGHDGSLSGVLSMTKHSDGYHTIHAIGESRSGDAIDLYQSVFIHDTEGVLQTTTVPFDGANTTGESPYVHPEIVATSTKLNQNTKTVEMNISSSHVQGDSLDSARKVGSKLRWTIIGLCILGVLLSVWVVVIKKRKTKTLPGYKE